MREEERAGDERARIKAGVRKDGLVAGFVVAVDSKGS